MEGKNIFIFNNYKLLDRSKYIIKKSKKLLNLMVNFLFPIECFGCNKEGYYLCEDCFSAISLNKNQYCFKCKKNNAFGETCLDCSSLLLNGILIASDYDIELLKKLLTAFKYNFIKDIGYNLGQILVVFFANYLKNENLDKVGDVPDIFLELDKCLVISVPLSKKRLRWRGFNQAEILGRYFSDFFSLEFNSSSLIRSKHKKPQAKLNEKEREINLLNSFSWLGNNLNKRNIILIDDVATTGSTLNECAKVLKANGAGEVWGLVVAKG